MLGHRIPGYGPVQRTEVSDVVDEPLADSRAPGCRPPSRPPTRCRRWSSNACGSFRGWRTLAIRSATIDRRSLVPGSHRRPSPTRPLAPRRRLATLEPRAFDTRGASAHSSINLRRAHGLAAPTRWRPSSARAVVIDGRSHLGGRSVADATCRLCDDLVAQIVRSATVRETLAPRRGSTSQATLPRSAAPGPTSVEFPGHCRSPDR